MGIEEARHQGLITKHSLGVGYDGAQFRGAIAIGDTVENLRAMDLQRESWGTVTVFLEPAAGEQEALDLAARDIGVSGARPVEPLPFLFGPMGACLVAALAGATRRGQRDRASVSWADASSSSVMAKPTCTIV